jgi:uncharacterized SAM-binding protein YcdF (DUF218 family)
MDVTRAQRAILQVLSGITPRNARIGDLSYYQVIDAERHHYQLVVSGWQLGKRVHGIVAQMDIKDGLIWVQEDGTDVGVANKLERLGVPADQIVLAYQAAQPVQPPNGFAAQ